MSDTVCVPDMCNSVHMQPTAIILKGVVVYTVNSYILHFQNIFCAFSTPE